MHQISYCEVFRILINFIYPFSVCVCIVHIGLIQCVQTNKQYICILYLLIIIVLSVYSDLYMIEAVTYIQYASPSLDVNFDKAE